MRYKKEMLTAAPSIFNTVSGSKVWFKNANIITLTNHMGSECTVIKMGQMKTSGCAGLVVTTSQGKGIERKQYQSGCRHGSSAVCLVYGGSWKSDRRWQDQEPCWRSLQHDWCRSLVGPQRPPCLEHQLFSEMRQWRKSKSCNELHVYIYILMGVVSPYEKIRIYS